jgi:hypothetical protein
MADPNQTPPSKKDNANAFLKCVSPNGEETPYKYRYSTGEQVIAGQIVLYNGEKWRVVRGNGGTDMENPQLRIQNLEKKTFSAPKVKNVTLLVPGVKGEVEVKAQEGAGVGAEAEAEDEAGDEAGDEAEAEAEAGDEAEAESEAGSDQWLIDMLEQMKLSDSQLLTINSYIKKKKPSLAEQFDGVASPSKGEKK